MEVNSRVRILNGKEMGVGPVLYWMSRDQRSVDNWALEFGIQKAAELKQPLVVCFSLVPGFLGATNRMYEFMIRGLEEVCSDLHSKKIPFYLLKGEPVGEVVQFIKSNKIGCVVTDFSPLRIGREWREAIAKSIDVSTWEVDAHNIVPVWEASEKQEFGAYTLRGKLANKLAVWLNEPINSFSDLNNQSDWGVPSNLLKWDEIKGEIDVDVVVGLPEDLKPGMKAAESLLEGFIEGGIKRYGEERNDPLVDVQSGLSPYLHFGQISSQRVAWNVLNVKRPQGLGKEGVGVFNMSKKGVVPIPKDDVGAFVEELVVRRELADNFCFYNENYDSFEGFPDWAKKTLDEHRKDVREYVYTKEEFENGTTHDELWNAAQREMVISGKMHGYMRMYWAKKILEWTKTPEDAIEIAIYLNDRYEIDGRDPNGYVGIAWSIGGVHDRAWTERDVFGKIRFMSYDGCKRKFDVKAYVERWSGKKQLELV